MPRQNLERHRINHIGWIRAAVLGANDGIISISSLILGLASAGAAHKEIILSGVAALIAGAMSMASGEYVSVQSQLDTENADIEKERLEILVDPVHENAELAQIYIRRGLSVSLAGQVASQLTAKNALKAHTRDELGITEAMTAKPVLAAGSSALAFTIGAALPLGVSIWINIQSLVLSVSISSLVFLMLLGMISAYVSGSSMMASSLRIVFWGATSMALTSVVGQLIGSWF